MEGNFNDFLYSDNMRLERFELEEQQLHFAQHPDMSMEVLNHPVSFLQMLQILVQQHQPQATTTTNISYPPLPPSVFESECCVTQAKVQSKAKVERKRKKRCRTLRKAEEAESQRISHIAVERNRRRLMNEHLNTLKSLMPPSYVPRGDQASIVGGAIDFVKELEQYLHSLQAEKDLRTVGSKSDGIYTSVDGFFTSPHFSGQKSTLEDGGANVDATVVQNHVNLRVLAPNRPRQLVRVVGAMEEMKLVVLHLNVTSLNGSVLYSLNLKIEEECKLRSADEIASAVQQIFSYIGTSC